MDDTFNIINSLFSFQFLLFCLAIYAITFIFQKIVVVVILDNPKMPGTRTSKIWKDLILPIFPIVFGCSMGLVAPKYPYPEDLKTTSGRIVFGLVAGMLSSIVYRILKSFLKEKMNISLDEDLPIQPNNQASLVDSVDKSKEKKET